jgi:hypothetical protein
MPFTYGSRTGLVHALFIVVVVVVDGVGVGDGFSAR